VKTWPVSNEVLDHAAPAKAKAGSPPASLNRAVHALEEAGPQAAHRAVRQSVRAYARDPSEGNALKVEIAVAALRQQRARAAIGG
jgi:hypothetical protein